MASYNNNTCHMLRKIEKNNKKKFKIFVNKKKMFGDIIDSYLSRKFPLIRLTVFAHFTESRRRRVTPADDGRPHHGIGSADTVKP